MRDREIVALQEAYASIYSPQREFEGWVNELMEEGYDLSEYTWDEMYEIYMSEEGNRLNPRTGNVEPQTKYAKRTFPPNPTYTGIKHTSGKPGIGKVLPGGLTMSYELEGETVDEMATTQTQFRPPYSAGTTGERKAPPAPQLPKPVPTTPRKPSPVGTIPSTRKPLNNSVDLFDTILEHLVAEGYADTNEAALKIMANMSEEWKQSIVEEVLDERNRGERGMSDKEVTRRRNLGGNVRSRVSASSLGDHGPQSAIQKFHKGKAKQRREIHKSGRGTRGDTGESGGQSRYQANKDHSDGYPSIIKRGDGPY